MLYREYYKQVLSVLDHVMATQSEPIEQAAELVANAFQQDGLLYVFGCGHSHIVGEDLFYRAGGMAPVCAMLEPELMLHVSAVKSSLLERTPGLAEPVFQKYNLTPRDVLLVASTSGINPVPVEMAQCARRAGVPVIAIVSSAYFNDQARTLDGKKLFECADVYIDNGACHGDASLPVGGEGGRIGPVSTLSSCMIAQCVVSQAAELLWQQGGEPPVYISGNVPGGMEENQELIHRYMGRMQHL